MFSPEINFLKERPQEQVTAGLGALEDSRVSGLLGGFNAVIAGGAVLGVAVIGTVLIHQWFSSQLRTLQNQQTQVVGELTTSTTELTRLRQVESELNAIKAQAEAFKAFFGQVQPWSAILQDVRKRIPADVWITTLTSAVQSPPEGSTVTQPATVLTIQGESLTFEQVNDFVLTLLQSPFVESVLLVRGEKQEPTQDTLLPSVSYQLDVTLKNQKLESSDFEEALEEARADGLLEKIEILRDLNLEAN